jgi:AcrR family transcriptional regulator
MNNDVLRTYHKSGPPVNIEYTRMSTEATKGTRAYRKRRRAEQEANTRERIAAAAVRLHQTVGPSRASVSAVAREAGVQRATVYRHFPTEEALFDACTAHYYARNPMPDAEAWSPIADPDERLRHALAELYAYFDHSAEMYERTSRDVTLVPAMAKAVGRFAAYFEGATAVLLRGRPQRGRRRERVAAAIGHAVSFPTWRSLVRQQGLSAEEAVELMMGMVAAAGR